MRVEIEGIDDILYMEVEINTWVVNNVIRLKLCCWNRAKSKNVHLNAGEIQIDLENEKKVNLSMILYFSGQGRISDVADAQRQEQPHGGGIGVMESRADMSL